MSFVLMSRPRQGANDAQVEYVVNSAKKGFFSSYPLNPALVGVLPGAVNVPTVTHPFAPLRNTLPAQAASRASLGATSAFDTCQVLCSKLNGPGKARDICISKCQGQEVEPDGPVEVIEDVVKVNLLYAALSLAGASLGAYHGYKRNKSVGWAVSWFFLGSMFPFITIPVSLAQGFGQPEKK